MRAEEWTIPEAFDLRNDDTLRLPRGVAAAVRVERGTVLVTQAGDPEDHVLEPGDELRLPAGGVAVAWALTDARIAVFAAEPAPLAA
jgi:hypothetical protein